MRFLTAICAAMILVGCAASVALYTTVSTPTFEESLPPPSSPPPPPPQPVVIPESISLPQEELLRYREEPVGGSSSIRESTVDSGKIANDIVSQLEPANMVFSVDPKRSNITNHISVSVIIDLSQSLGNLKLLTRDAEIISAAQIRVSKVVIARVIAPNFTVISITPEEQPISQFESTRWDWKLIPTKTGQQEIHITINAEVDVGGVTKVRSIQTFRQTVEVEITFWQVIKGWILKYWQWAVSTLLLPLGLWLWKRKVSKPT
jgi:hypothetical protein